MTITTKKDGLCYWDSLPRLPWSQQTPSQSDNQWKEIIYWQSEIYADPILQDCLLNHQFAEYIGDKNYHHDLALKRAEQLWETKQEIEKFGKVVTRDYRVFGNKKYADYQASFVQAVDSTRKCTYGLTATLERTITVREKPAESDYLDRLKQANFYHQYAKKWGNQDFITECEKLANTANKSEIDWVYQLSLVDGIFKGIRKIKSAIDTRRKDHCDVPGDRSKADHRAKSGRIQVND